VKILLDAGADRNHSDGEGNTAIGIALRAGNNDIAGDIRTAGAAR
jgi:ankyrin repeat protein